MPKYRTARRLWFAGLLLLAVSSVESITVPVNAQEQQTETPAARALARLIPMPASVSAGEGVFTISGETRIVLDQMEITPAGQALADVLNPAFGIQAETTMAPPDPQNMIVLSIIGGETLGSEGYRLNITPERVTLEAHTAAGAFYGVQTLKQLLPAKLEGASAELPAAEITDRPRFAYRGVMLDVARHFFGTADVKRVIDLMAAYKLNRLHLHLTDDQGWRIEIESWPALTTIGSQTEVGGGEGGYYTQADYREIVAYTAARYVEIVPEIDMPGHTNAALASYGELNCDGQARQLYTGTEVGFSSLCAGEEVTYDFVDDVVRELAAMTPGAYLHIGGDESKSTTDEDYRLFMGQVQRIVAAHGKQAIGWEEMAQTPLAAGTVVQHWFSDFARGAVEQGAKVILSPASKAYLDMKYDEATPLGLSWAGTSDTRDSYSWEPATLIAGVGESDIYGVEAPLWSETLETIEDIEYMLFPRLMGIAEIGWSPAEGRAWDEYKVRLAAHGPRLTAMDVNFYRDAAVAWEE